MNAFDTTFKLGMSLTLSKKQLDLKLNPASRIFRPYSHFSLI